MINDALTFGELVDKLIKSEGITKTSAAARLGMTDAAIHRLINNISSPSLNRMLTVLNDYGYTVAAVRKDAELPEGAAFLLYAETDAEREKKRKAAEVNGGER